MWISIGGGCGSWWLGGGCWIFQAVGLSIDGGYWLFCVLGCEGCNGCVVFGAVVVGWWPLPLDYDLYWAKFELILF